MILDERSELADDTALSTAGTGRALVGDVIDLRSIPVGDGPDLYFVVAISQAVTSAGAATVAFELASDAQATIATDGTATLHFATGAIGKATLVAGYVAMSFMLRALGPAAERFLGLLQNVGTAALTAGNINAFLTATPAKVQIFPDAIQ